MKNYLIRSIILSTFTAAVNIAFAAQPLPTAIPVLSCPWGCGPPESDTILMKQMIQSESKIMLLPQETPGYLYNIREMMNERQWKKAIFGTEDAIMQLAFQGGSKGLKEFLPEPIKIKFKLLYGEAWWAHGKFFATFDPQIQKISDFKKKRISLGLRTQSDWGLFPRLLLEHGYGITPKVATIRHLTPAALTQQLIDGSADVAVTSLGVEPHGKEWLVSGPIRQLEATGKPIYYIGIDEETIAKVNKKLGTTFLPLVIPAGTLPKQTEPLKVAVVRGYKAAHPDFPDELAYQLVMSIAKLAPNLRELHPLWKIWSPELMVHGLSDENVHPGAKRAYIELGWWNKAKQYPAVTYPQ